MPVCKNHFKHVISFIPHLWERYEPGSTSVLKHILGPVKCGFESQLCHLCPTPDKLQAHGRSLSILSGKLGIGKEAENERGLTVDAGFIKTAAISLLLVSSVYKGKQGFPISNVSMINMVGK